MMTVMTAGEIGSDRLVMRETCLLVSGYILLLLLLMFAFFRDKVCCTGNPHFGRRSEWSQSVYALSLSLSLTGGCLSARGSQRLLLQRREGTDDCERLTTL